jgi:hypothetical protein
MCCCICTVTPSERGINAKQEEKYILQHHILLAFLSILLPGPTGKTVVIGTLISRISKRQHVRGTLNMSGDGTLLVCGTHILSRYQAHLGQTEKLQKTIFTHSMATVIDT